MVSIFPSSFYFLHWLSQVQNFLPIGIAFCGVNMLNTSALTTLPDLSLALSCCCFSFSGNSLNMASQNHHLWVLSQKHILSLLYSAFSSTVTEFLTYILPATIYNYRFIYSLIYLSCTKLVQYKQVIKLKQAGTSRRKP